jgi:cell division protein FtsQ
MAATPSRTRMLRLAAATLAVVFAAVALAFAWFSADRFLISHPRFVMSVDEDTEEPAIQIDGLKHASRERIAKEFLGDKGKSIYVSPLASRRESVLRLDWVKDAAVTRIWPDHIAVRVWERHPVAFVQTGRAITTLVDEDGVLLPLEDAGKFRLPVVIGVEAAQPLADRRLRIKRLLRLQQEIGGHVDKVSEVNLADLDNVKITYPFHDRAMILYLGHQHYARRLKMFLDNIGEVAQRLPDARTLDLRLDDRITVVPEPVAPAAPAPEVPRAE